MSEGDILFPKQFIFPTIHYNIMNDTAMQLSLHLLNKSFVASLVNTDEIQFNYFFQLVVSYQL